MSGQFTAASNGKQISGPWEAELVNPSASQAAPSLPTSPNAVSDTSSAPKPGPAPKDGNSPELSGKWNVAYEYNFKTVSTTLFLEQNNDKLTGHGTDNSTQEKFTIEQGWYKYPKVTLVWHYRKSNGANSDRTMMYKGDVSIVNESDYQGPYISGKTQGGGNWEAQMFR
jgi:hypothetical protein